MRTSDLSKWQVALLYTQGDYKKAEYCYYNLTKYQMVWYYNNYMKPKRELSDYQIQQIIKNRKYKKKAGGTSKGGRKRRTDGFYLHLPKE